MKRMKIPAAAALIAAACYLACCAAADGTHIMPNTTVNGTDISGMDGEEARAALERDADLRRRDAVLTVMFAGTGYRVDARDVLEWEYKPAVERALKPGRGAFLTRGYFWLRSLVKGNHIRVSPVIKSRKALSDAIEESGILAAGTTTQTSYRVEGDRLIFKMGEAGEEADSAALGELVAAALQNGDTAPVECPVVRGRVKEVDLKQVYRRIRKEPENATLDPDDSYRIKESVTGVDFDKKRAESIIKSAQEGSTAEIELILKEPEITTEDLKEHLFADRLATYTTQVGGTANRRDNISLAAERCSGTILLGGDVFSYNAAVGEQTAQTGYKPANATLNGTLVQAYGGGICQVSSTIFAAALYADLEIRERWEHEYVPRYMDAGMDAAVAWDALDLKLCNDGDYPVRIDVSYRDGVLTADIWGTKTDDSIVEIETHPVTGPDQNHAVKTIRKIYNGDKSQMVLEQVAYSMYLN